MVEQAGRQAPRIYLAGASAELELCEHWRDELRRVGFEITHDWMAQVRQAGAANNPEWSYEKRRRLAEEDLAGVASADAVWLVVPPPGSLSIGMWVELGYALGREHARHTLSPKKTICVSGPWRTIFQDAIAPGWSFSTHDAAFVQLCDVFGGRLVRAKSVAISAE